MTTRVVKVLKTCEKCGKQWEVYPSHAARRYCSMACLEASRPPRKVQTCPCCGMDYEVKASHGRRLYCSVVCKAIMQRRRVEVACPDCGRKTIRRLSAGVARCPKCTALERAARQRARGYSPRVNATPASEARRLARLRSLENRARISAAAAGRPMATASTRKFSGRHWRSVAFALQAPDGREYRGRGIELFVHDNPDLFDPADIVPKTGRYGLPTVCNASAGLRSVNRACRNSWKGWTRTNP